MVKYVKLLASSFEAPIFMYQIGLEYFQWEIQITKMLSQPGISPGIKKGDVIVVTQELMAYKFPINLLIWELKGILPLELHVVSSALVWKVYNGSLLEFPKLCNGAYFTISISNRYDGDSHQLIKTEKTFRQKFRQKSELKGQWVSKWTKQWGK